MTHIENSYFIVSARLRAGQLKIMFESQKGWRFYFWQIIQRSLWTQSSSYPVDARDTISWLKVARV